MRTLAILLLSVNYAWADGKGEENETSHTGHVFEKLVDGEKLEVDPRRFSTFLEGLSDCQVAVVSVQGMVCDFCARGIEKMFRKGKGKSETLDINDPDFMDKVIRQMKIGKKAGGKVMKMRGGGLATKGTNFSIR